MVPALNKFAKETGFDSSVYREHLDDGWRNLDQGTSSFDYGEAAKQCLDHAPDTENFTHPLTSAALNAALSVVETMEFLADNDVDHLVEVAVLARVTAASYAQLMAATPPHSLNYDEVVKHPLVQHELQRQADDLEFLEALPTCHGRNAIHAMAQTVRSLSRRRMGERRRVSRDNQESIVQGGVLFVFAFLDSE